MPLFPPHLLIDGFLSPTLHDALLDHTLRQEERFSRAAVRKGQTNVQADDRLAWRNDRLGELEAPLRDAVLQVAPELFERLGIRPFVPARVELELSAHRDGDYFRPHRDTFFSSESVGLATDRVVTAVYYFHLQPRGFTGGEFAIHPFGEGEPLLIEPRDNRLVAIPAFALHEVRRISCAPDEFRYARFAVNAWLHKARDSGS